MTMLRKADQTSAGEAMGHEMMEAYSSAKNPTETFAQAHANASQYFPAPTQSNAQTFPNERNLPTLTQTWTWARGTTKGVTVTYKLITPIDLHSVTNRAVTLFR